MVPQQNRYSGLTTSNPGNPPQCPHRLAYLTNTCDLQWYQRSNHAPIIKNIWRWKQNNNHIFCKRHEISIQQAPATKTVQYDWLKHKRGGALLVQDCFHMWGRDLFPTPQQKDRVYILTSLLAGCSVITIFPTLITSGSYIYHWWHLERLVRVPSFPVLG